VKLKWTEEALADLAKIDTWLTQNVDPVTAAETLERIRGQARGLLRFPRRKPRIGRGRHYSQVDRTSHLLIYSVGEGHVTIMRVRHNREDWRP
jgi:plasmid stabilization system protein ParE